MQKDKEENAIRSVKALKNAIDMLVADHKQVQKWFNDFEKIKNKKAQNKKLI